MDGGMTGYGTGVSYRPDLERQIDGSAPFRGLLVQQALYAAMDRGRHHIFRTRLNFLSLGLSLADFGPFDDLGVGLPTWERKGELWREGARLAYIIVLYEALPSFLFSLGFLLSTVPLPSRISSVTS